jgi:hypothetical protein
LYGSYALGANELKSRFTKIDIEDFEHVSGVAVNKIEVLHDNETGDEIVCMENTRQANNTLSCYKSGRAWK